ncbi:MAG: bifunctional DNA-formamidopyrimidine glycosylase/DNA-(apurinic or apyrimidinic site) lyase [Phycisphaerae bacterium]
MPELPEVEQVRRSLEPHLLGRRVKHVALFHQSYALTPALTLQNLLGQRFLRTHRHGKYMRLETQSGQQLMIHLGMTGWVDVSPPELPREAHTHLVITLDNHHELRCVDPRRFGGVWWFASAADACAHPSLAKLGPDTLEITPQHLWQAWRGIKAPVKARLLGQTDIAGVGNIYADEALFRAGIHPRRSAGMIPLAQVKLLTRHLRTIMLRSIRMGGTTLRDYRDADGRQGEFTRKLLIYGHSGQPCPSCGKPLTTAIIAARTTVYCTHCQPLRG